MSERNLTTQGKIMGVGFILVLIVGIGYWAGKGLGVW